MKKWLATRMFIVSENPMWAIGAPFSGVCAGVLGILVVLVTFPFISSLSGTPGLVLAAFVGIASLTMVAWMVIFGCVLVKRCLITPPPPRSHRA